MLKSRTKIAQVLRRGGAVLLGWAAVLLVIGMQQAVHAQSGNPTPTYPPTWTPAPTLTQAPSLTLTPTGTATATRISPIIQTFTALATLRTPPPSMTPFGADTTLEPESTLTDESTVEGPPPPISGMLVFQERTDAGVILVTTNLDGSNRVELTKPVKKSEDINPRWSPDGSIILFQSNRGGKPELYEVKPDGTGLTRLENGEQPAWSPDGKEIVFVYERGGFKELYAMQSNATKARRLTKAAKSNDMAPAWSPDGKYIAFSSTREGSKGDLWILNAADGSNAHRLTTQLSNGPVIPSWSADGSQLAIVYQDSQGISRLATIKPDGNDLISLTEKNLDLKVISRPVWSPDGNTLIYTGQKEDGQWAIFALNLAAGRRASSPAQAAEIGSVDWFSK